MGVEVPFTLPSFLPSPGAMLFHAVEYLLVFLPAVALLYYFLGRFRHSVIGIVWLLCASVFFYGCWSVGTLWLLAASIVVNYLIAIGMLRAQAQQQASIIVKSLLFIGIFSNLALLGYFKYAGFFVDTANVWFNESLPVPDIVLPLGISFFTFTQMAFLVDVYREHVKEYKFLNYCLFVVYFPHLIAGPILHHSEMMPQFEAPDAQRICWRNVYHGFFILATGILKKVVLADGLALQANAGFDQGELLLWHEAWLSMLSYSLQLYFDFSGYTDMAIGASLILNIRLPENFNSPYKAMNIQDFWRRWHITLSRWLRDYLYVPLGGSYKGEWRTYIALMLTFLLGGLWHGAAWTFVVWGGLHGVAVCIHRCWLRAEKSMPGWLGWLSTFLFVNIAWIFFRSSSLQNAWLMVKSAIGFGGSDIEGFARLVTQSISQTVTWNPCLISIEHNPVRACLLVVVGLILVLRMPNTREWQAGTLLEKPQVIHAIFVGLWAGLALFCAGFMNVGFSKFIYFYF